MSRNAFSYTPLGTAHIEALPPTRVNDQSEDTTATTPTPLTLCELAQTNALPQTDIINPSSDAAAITSTQSELAQTNAPSQTQIEDAATDATAIREEAEILRRASLPNSLRRAAELHGELLLLF